MSHLTLGTNVKKKIAELEMNHYGRKFDCHQVSTKNEIQFRVIKSIISAEELGKNILFRNDIIFEAKI